MALRSFQWSEEVDLPVVVRLTNDHFKWRGWCAEPAQASEATDQVQGSKKLSKIEASKYVVHPKTWKPHRDRLEAKLRRVQDLVDGWLKIDPSVLAGGKRLRVQVGACQGTPADAEDEEILKVATVSTYPLPSQLMASVSSFHEVEVEESGAPYALNLLQAGQAGLGTVQIRKVLRSEPDHSDRVIVWDGLEKLFSALATIQPRHVVADLGQSTQESKGVVTSCLCLGSAVAVAWGVAFGSAGRDYPFCISGDASLLHGGGRSLLDDAVSCAESQSIGLCIVVIDNGGSASTGGQMVSSCLHAHLPSFAESVLYADTSEGEFLALFRRCASERRFALIHLQV